MKLEIEVKESEIKDAIERHIRVAIAEKMNSYMSNEIIKNRINQAWSEAVDSEISAQLSNLPEIGETVRKKLEAKLQGRLMSLMGKAKF